MFHGRVPAPFSAARELLEQLAADDSYGNVWQETTSTIPLEVLSLSHSATVFQSVPAIGREPCVVCRGKGRTGEAEGTLELGDGEEGDTCYFDPVTSPRFLSDHPKSVEEVTSHVLPGSLVFSVR